MLLMVLNGVLGTVRTFAKDQPSPPPKSSDEISIPDEDRDRIEQLIQPLDSGAAAKLRKYGTLPANLLSEAATFYLAMGLTTTWKCYQEKDPVYCKAYLDGMKDPYQHAGFGLFVLTSHASTWGLKKLMKKSSWAESVSGFAGMAVGSITSEMFMAVTHLPEFQQLLHLSSISSEADREKKRSELLGIIWNKTFGNSEWWSAQAPQIASMIGATVASQLTYLGLLKALTYKKQSTPILKNLSCESFGERLALLLVPPKGPGVKSYFHRRAIGLGNLMLFMGYDSLLHPVATHIWNRATLEKDLSKDEIEPVTPSTGEEAIPFVPTETEKRYWIEKRGQLWNRYRLTQFQPLDEVKSLHEHEIESLHDNLIKTHDFYTWFKTDFDPESSEWDDLRKKYYSPTTRPEEVKKDLTKYLRSFFDGVAPEKSLSLSKDIHGIPIPGSINTSVAPYCGVKVRVPSAQKMDYDQLVQFYRGHEKAEKDRRIKDNRYQAKFYSTEEDDAYLRLKLSAQKIQVQKLREFENHVGEKIIPILKTESDGTKKVPHGVLATFDRQIYELSKLENPSNSENFKKFLKEKIARVQEQKKISADLLTFYQMPFEKRTASETSINAILRDMITTQQDRGSVEAFSNYLYSFLIH